MEIYLTFVTSKNSFKNQTIVYENFSVYKPCTGHDI